MSGTLTDRRHEAADKEFETYDFGDAAIGEVDGWEYTEPGTEYTRIVWFSDPENPEGDDIRGTFTVVFSGADGAVVADAYASIDGNDVGCRPLNRLVQAAPDYLAEAPRELLERGVEWYDANAAMIAPRLGGRKDYRSIVVVEGPADRYTDDELRTLFALSRFATARSDGYGDRSGANHIVVAKQDGGSWFAKRATWRQGRMSHQTIEDAAVMFLKGDEPDPVLLARFDDQFAEFLPQAPRM